MGSELLFSIELIFGTYIFKYNALYSSKCSSIYEVFKVITKIAPIY